MKTKTLLLTVISAIVIGCASFAVGADLPHLITFPKGCLAKGVMFKNKQAFFYAENNQKARLYLLANTTNATVIINHLKEDPGASAGWASEISSKHWSALMLNAKQFKMICQVKQGQQYRSADCQQVIQVCQFPRYEITNKELESGSFWLVENKPVSVVLQQIKNRGVVVH